MKYLSLLSLLIIHFLYSCESMNNEPDPLFPGGNGFFILNEGNFMAGNGSISFYSHETAEIYNGLFASKNGRALGDVPTFMAQDGSKGFIIVNNSGTIEVIDMKTMESLATITGLDSPRQMVIAGEKAYVSSLSSDEITVIDVSDLTVYGTIDAGCCTEALAVSGNRLFASHWAGGNSIKVINLETEQVIRTITTGLEPESMVLDCNGRLWVLCTGGYMNEEVPGLYRINTATLEIEAMLPFRTLYDNPSSLAVNKSGDTLFYIDEGIRRMPVTAAELPSAPFIPSDGRLMYKLAVSPYNSMICVTDAIDYQQKGDLLVFSSKGILADTEQAGIIPGYMYCMGN